ncbi:MAG: hypothetical protein ACUVWA_06910 [Candidatus Oleimicrobiaceae bacterium]
MRKGSVIFFGLVLFCSAVAWAQTTSKIDGVVFGDYFYNLAHHQVAEKDRNAFVFRRIYFTFQNNITEAVKIRFRLESESEKFGEVKKITPFVKHAFLQWGALVPKHDLFVGLIETNAFKNSEELWGYRSIEKTIMDLNKISSSADLGAAIKGDLFGGLVHHWLAVYNGSGYGSSEVDRFKKVGYAVWLTPLPGLIIEGYADYENLAKREPQTAAELSSAKDYVLASSYHTVKAFAGYGDQRFSIGTEVFRRTNRASGMANVVLEGDKVKTFTPADVQRFGFSAFASAITPIRGLKIFARYDFFDPNAQSEVFTGLKSGSLVGGENNETQTVFVGLDYIPVAGIHVMPNLIVKNYTAPGVKKDVTARLTLSYNFSSGKIVVE